MQRKFLPVTLVLVVLLAMLAVLGLKNAADVSPTIGIAESKEVYLTFDDGPSTVVTNRILDTLKEEGVKATFFIVSDRVEGREKTLKRIAEEGHTVGVHSASHDYAKIYASEKTLLADVEKCAAVIRKQTGIVPKVYRFPGGGAHKQYTKLLTERGYTVVSWNAVCGDEEIRGADSQRLYEETVKTSGGKKSVVLLLHDSANHKQTAEALPRIIAYYKTNGYTFKQF